MKVDRDHSTTDRGDYQHYYHTGVLNHGRSPSSKRETLETVYRVYRLPDELRKRVKAKREKHNVTLQSVIEAATTESLPKIVATLKTMGLGFDGKKHVARLPMTDSLLGAFRVASKQTGIPASRLLQAALSLTCKGGK